MTAANTKSVERDALHDMLMRCWYTHDAMWLANARELLGMETANKLNLGAINSMAPLEVQRVRKFLGLADIRSLADVRYFLTETLHLFGTEAMDFDWDWSSDNRQVTVSVRRCFAFEGISRLGAIAEYQCGIFERILAWLTVLGVEFDILPTDKRCLMHHDGKCRKVLRLHLPTEL